jgi:hypothetical protein
MARRVAVVVLAVVLDAVLSSAQVPDHLQCYKVRDPLLLSGTVDLDSPQFGAAPGCKIARGTPPLFCVPATKIVVAVRDRATGQPITPLPVAGPDPGDRLCYKIKCEAPSPPDTEVTDQFGTRTVTGLRAKLLCTPAVKGGPPTTTTSTTTTTTSSTTTTTQRFVDNGDGTVTDNQTGLQWEKKDNTCPGIHCVNDTYQWSSTGTAPDGGAFTAFLGTLNNGTSPDGTATSACFAGHCDWRLPAIEELAGIVDPTQGSCGGGSGPCIDQTVFGPTVDSLYWSATTFASDPFDAWSVVFGGSDGVAFVGKGSDRYVRGVRSGL